MNVQDRPGGAGNDQASSILENQRRAFIAAGPPSLEERRRDLRKLRDAVRAEADSFIRAVNEDFGCRSRQDTLVAEIWPVVASARHALSHLRKWMKPKRVGVGLELLPGRARIESQPLGVVGVISPWNYPVMLSLDPLIAALAAGNRVMLKPSELTPRTSAFLADFLQRLFPQEQVATVLGDADIGAAFAALPFDHLLFTGSTAVGRKVMQAAAQNLTPVTLELGGKSPAIVADDADMAAAAAGIAAGKLLNAGQTCIAPDYALVPRDRLDAFVAAFQQAAQKLYPTISGNGDYTSIVSERHHARLNGMIEAARAGGARIVETGQGSAAERKIAPTLVIDPGDELALMQEEIFGPVLPVRTHVGLDDAIAYVNAHPRPLALYYFGRDGAKRDELLRRTVAGGVCVNDTLMHFVAENLPFGGVGPSGMGAYHGEEGFRTFSHRKGVFLQSGLNGRGLLSPPYGKAFDAMLKFMIGR